MSKARTLGDLVSTGSVLADGTIDAAEIGNLTLPSGGDIVGTTATQTLTNKTIDYTANTITNLPETNPAGSTGQVQYNNAGAFGALADGTSGQVLTSAGAGAAPTWENLPAGASLVRVARTSNTALTSANISNLIAITSGTFTQTFDACSSLGNGWFCYVQNAGTGDITLDPNGSETIDGLTSYVMYPGEVRLVQCDGSSLRSVVLNAFYKTFTTSTTFTKPPGYEMFGLYVLGGGGGGGAGIATTSGRGGNGGGGGGARLRYLHEAVSPVPSSVTVTIGSGGSGSSTSGGDGFAGGTTSFGSFATASGGGGGGGGRVYNNTISAGAGGDTTYWNDPLYNQQYQADRFPGALSNSFTADNYVHDGSLSFYGGGSGGAGQISGVDGGAGGWIAAFASTGGTGASAGTGQGQDMTGTYGAGGGGSIGRGGHGGYGCGGGGGGTTNTVFYNGGDGGSGLVQVWGVI